MSLLPVLGLAWALGGGILASGLCVVARFDVGRGSLERAALALAFGRILLGAATLLTTTLGVPWLLHGFVALSLFGAWRLRGRIPARMGNEDWQAARWPLVIGLVASSLLVHATVGRSGLPIGPAGAEALVFFGRDLSFDPLAHIAAAHHLIGSGLPLEISFVAGTEFTNSYLPVGVRAGSAILSGASLLDLVFRVLPLFDLFGLCLATVALVRALGGNVLAAGLATLLMVLGSGADFLLPLWHAVTGHAPAGRDTWSFFGPYLLGANSITAGLGTFFAALLLLRRLEAGSAAPWLAGALVAACFEIKLFLWAAAVPALVLLALGGLRGGARDPLRTVAIAAVAFSLPSLLEKAFWAVRLADAGNQGFGLCIGCLPRYLAEAAVRGQLPPFDVFARFDNTVLLRHPSLLLDSVLVTVIVSAVALGARLVAIPTLWRGARDGEPGVARVHRLVGSSALVGVAGAVVARTSPHYLNAAEFYWPATFGAWPFVALAVASAAGPTRAIAAIAVLGLSLASTAHVLGPLGYGAPPSTSLSLAERDLLLEFRGLSEPGDAVLEPSILDDLEVPSPVTWIAGRPVHLTNRSAASTLPEAAARARFSRIQDVFDGDDVATALRAIEDSGVRFVYAPRHRPLPAPLARALEPVLERPAGSVYRAPRP